MKTYILADNQDLTRLAVESIVRQDTANSIFRATDRAGLVQLLKQYESAVVVLDYTLFDFVDEDQLLIVSERFEQAQWLLLSDELSPAFLRRVIYSSHRFSVVYKDSPVHEVRQALTTAASHERHISQRALEAVIVQQRESELSSVLTATEREIVIAIAAGKTTKEIAAERFSSVHTVTTHRKNIFHKLGVNTAHEVIKYALRAGLIDQSEFYI